MYRAFFPKDLSEVWGLLNSVPWAVLFPSPEMLECSTEKIQLLGGKMAHNTFRQSHPCRPWWWHWFVCRCYPLSLCQVQVVLVRDHFRVRWEASRTWKERTTSKLRGKFLLHWTLQNSTSLRPLPSTLSSTVPAKLHGLHQLIPCVHKLPLQTIAPDIEQIRKRYNLNNYGKLIEFISWV